MNQYLMILKLNGQLDSINESDEQLVTELINRGTNGEITLLKAVPDDKGLNSQHADYTEDVFANETIIQVRAEVNPGGINFEDKDDVLKGAIDLLRIYHPEISDRQSLRNGTYIRTLVTINLDPLRDHAKVIPGELTDN